MAKTAVAKGTLTVPLEDGLQAASADLSINFPYTQKINDDRVYSVATPSDAVSFGTMASGGAKLVLIKCTSGSCTVEFNGVIGLLVPLAPGGYFLWFNPAAGFVTGLTITTTGAANIEILALA